jgi:hypothetical protein
LPAAAGAGEPTLVSHRKVAPTRWGCSVILALMALLEATFWVIVGRHEPPRTDTSVLGDLNPDARSPSVS